MNAGSAVKDFMLKGITGLRKKMNPCAITVENMSLKFELYNILEQYPETRKGFMPLLIRYLKIKGADDQFINVIKDIPLESLRRMRQKLIEEDKAKGLNRIQPDNREYLKEQEQDWRKAYSNKQNPLI